MKIRHSIACCLAVALLTSGCSVWEARPSWLGAKEKVDPGHGFFGVVGNSFVKIDPVTGAATEIASSPELNDVGSLTYDPATQTIWGVTNASKRPVLITIDLETGAVTEIGRMALGRFYPTRIEGLAFNTSNGQLYAAGGRGPFASDRLLHINPFTARATELARIDGTLQDEIDAMAFVDDQLWATDTGAGETMLYSIDLKTGKATALSDPFPHKLTDMVLDPINHRLLGSLEQERSLVSLSLGGTHVEKLGPTHGEADFGGAPLSALTFAGPRGGSLLVFSDGFESGNTSRWSNKAKQKASDG